MSAAIHHIERLSPENVHLLAILFKKIYGKNISIENIRRKYDTTYLGKSYYGFIAFDANNQPIAYQGLIPFRVKYQDTIEIGAQSCDSMTLKQYQGKGIFGTLGKLAEEQLKKDGIHFSYGFPNFKSGKTYVKDEWEAKPGMIGFKIPVKTFSFEKIYRKLGLTNRYNKFVGKVLKPMLSEKRELSNSMMDDQHPGFLHDEDFFNYKTYTSNHVINIGGQKAWIKIQHQLLVGDINTSEENSLLKTIDALKKLSSKLGLSQIIIQVHKGSAQEIILSKHFASFPSWPLLYNNYSSTIPLEKLRVNYGDLDSF